MQTLLTTHRCHTFTVANSDHCCKTDKPQYWENQTYPFSTLTPHLFTPRPLPTTTTTHTTCPYLRIVLSRLVVYDCDPMDCGLPASSVHGDSPGKNTGVGCHALLQEIFPTQGSNPGLLTAGRFFTIWDTREVLCLLLIGPSTHPLVQPLMALVFLDFGFCKLDLVPCSYYWLAYLNTRLSSSPWTSGPQVSFLTSPSTWELLIIFQPSLRLNIPTHYSIG